MTRVSISLAFVVLGTLAFLGTRGGWLDPGASGSAHDTPLQLSGWPRDLSWDDFQNLKFSPLGQPHHAAAISSGFGAPGDGLYPQQLNDRWRFEQGSIEVWMAGAHSWVAEEHRSIRVLEHEQMHFDITGLAAQEWLEALREVEASSQAEALQVGRTSFERIQRKLRQVQRLFDHADRRRSDAHGEWKERIRKLMRNGGRLPEPGELPGFSGLGDG